ncbi:MAG: hypothetical protein GF334_05920 [Candidatus Altiarchaeales archaeon]|nr:hypothetical protein [Candidatus Altiarchaeales archaeon]
MSRRGFVLTLDVILAVFVTLFFAAAILRMSGTQEFVGSDYIYAVAVDVLTYAEKDGVLWLSVNGDYAPAYNLLWRQPRNLCFNLSLYNDSYGLLYSNATCNMTAANVVVAKRSFLNDTQFFLAELGVWYR